MSCNIKGYQDRTSRPMVAKEGPCNDCPWRKDAPKEYWHPEHFESIARTCMGDGMAIMLCHKSNEPSCKSNLICAGWIAAQGTDSIGVRLLMLQGIVKPDNDYAAGHDLHTFDEMLEANRIEVPQRGPYDHNIERLRAMMKRDQPEQST